MAARKPFLLRMDPAVFDALQRWAGDDLRSLNGQIEFLLRSALRQRQRLGDGGDGRSPERERPPTPGGTGDRG